MTVAEYSFVRFGESGSALPYRQDSDICFNAVSDTPITSLLIVDAAGNTIRETAQGIYQEDTVYWILPQFTERPERFRILLRYSNGLLEPLESSVFVLVDDDGNSSVLGYRSDDNNFGFYYSGFGFKNTVRLPVRLKETRYSQTRNVYGMLSGRQKILSGSVRDEYDLETDYIPEDMHRRLVIALMHDDVMINGVLVTQTGDYSADWDNYIMENGTKTAKGKCTVSANVVSRNSNCG
jgi:hypothetical protein